MVTTIDLSGQTLTDLRVEYTAGLRFTGGYFVRIETSFTLNTDSHSTYLSPDADPSEAFASMHGLVGKAISESRIDGGTLALTFDDGARLVVQPDGNYEAWTVAGPDGLLIVCMPSGELATWSGTPEGQADPRLDNPD
jgi:hypothetical protein